MNAIADTIKREETISTLLIKDELHPPCGSAAFSFSDVIVIGSE